MQSKVLHIIDHISLGGAQRILCGILADHPEHSFLTLRRKKKERHTFPMPPAQSILSLAVSPLVYGLQFLSLLHRIRQGGFNIIECHLTASWLLGLLLACLLSRREIHFLFHEHNAARMDQWYYPWLVKQAAHEGRVIAVSHTVRLAIEKHGVPQGKILLLPNYVDLNHFTPQTSSVDTFTPADWDDGVVIIGSASRMTCGKGWQDLLEIADRLRKQPYRFVFAGSGKDYARFKQEILRHGLSDHIHLAGYIEDMNSFYHHIDLLIFPSRVEAFGLVPVEAQACGIPVIVYQSPINAETLPEGSAWRVPMGDASGMADAIDLLWNQPQLMAALRNAGLENAQRFSYSIFRECLHAIYTLLLENETG